MVITAWMCGDGSSTSDARAAGGRCWRSESTRADHYCFHLNRTRCGSGWGTHGIVISKIFKIMCGDELGCSLVYEVSELQLRV